MLITALCKYYDILAAAGQVLPDGYSRVGVHYLVSLTPDGQIDGVTDWQETRHTVDKKGKIIEKRVPREIILPKRTEKTCIDANAVEHRPLYLFGLGYDEEHGLNTEGENLKPQKSHREFVKQSLTFLGVLDSPVVNAYRNFIYQWSPENERENPYLTALAKQKNYATAKYAFCLSGHPEILLHEDAALKERWMQVYSAGQTPEDGGTVAQCCVTGEVGTIARVHGKINGVSGGLSMGNILVCMKNDAENSYGKEQSYNSYVSEGAMRKYTEALNLLIHDKLHRTVVDETTVIHFALAPETTYDEVFSLFCDGETAGREETDQMIRSVMEDVRSGKITSGRLDCLGDIDPDVDFYMFGLKPNSSRLAVKFAYHRRFGEILQNLARHQLDMQVSEHAKPVAFWQIKGQLVVPSSSKDTVDPTLLSKIYESAVYGTDYPLALLSTVIRRVRVDSDDDKNQHIKVNGTRVGIIKACINRNNRLHGHKEEIKLALDIENRNPAYLCGRLFAVLEKLQEDAAGGNLNRTIKDSYFASASSTPSLVFPKLLRLAQNHLGKAKYPVFYNKLIGEIVGVLGTEFPSALPLYEQGKFIIGYYQQYQNFFIKSDKTNEQNDEEE